MNRVAVTGLGVVAPNGADLTRFREGLHQGRSGVRALTTPWAAQLAFNAAGLVDYDPVATLGKARVAGTDRVVAMALVAAREAIVQARLDQPGDLDRAAVYVGTGMGGQATIEIGMEELFLRGGGRIHPLLIPKAMNNAPAANIAIDWHCHGPNLTFSQACSSSAIALGEAAHRIRLGAVELAIAGGTEALLTLGMFKAWEALRTLAIPDPDDPGSACRPFSADRSGLVLGEGAAFAILESESHARQRGARVLAWISGYGASNDATHLTKPDAQGQAMAIRAALSDAGLAPEDIGYINAHGTATMAGDVAETVSIKSVLGDHAHRVPVSSTKSMHGHLIGAAGAVEFVATVIALDEGFLPPTINLRQPDPDCDLDYVPNQGRACPGLRHALTNSFAFGGSNAVLAVSRGDD